MEGNLLPKPLNSLYALALLVAEQYGFLGASVAMQKGQDSESSRGASLVKSSQANKKYGKGRHSIEKHMDPSLASLYPRK